MTRYISAMLCAALVWVMPLHAQQACTPERTWTFDPQETDNIGFKFVGRTLASVTSVTATNMRVAQADASPTSIIRASSVSGDTLTITVYPDYGCGAAGCRAGNMYQINAQVTDSNSLTPAGFACLNVRKTILRPR